MHELKVTNLPLKTQRLSRQGKGLLEGIESRQDDPVFQYWARQKDYGDLEDLKFPDEDGQARAIWLTKSEKHGQVNWEEDDNMDLYWSFDVRTLFLCGGAIVGYSLGWTHLCDSRSS